MIRLSLWLALVLSSNCYSVNIINLLIHYLYRSKIVRISFLNSYIIWTFTLFWQFIDWYWTASLLSCIANSFLQSNLFNQCQNKALYYRWMLRLQLMRFHLKPCLAAPWLKFPSFWNSFPTLWKHFYSSVGCNEEHGRATTMESKDVKDFYSDQEWNWWEGSSIFWRFSILGVTSVGNYYWWVDV